MLTLSRTRFGRITVIEAHGRIDSISARRLAQALTEASYSSRIVLDLSGVDYISGAGMRLLKNLQDHTGEVRLARPSDRVRDVLQIIGLDSAFQLYESRQAALRSLSTITNAHTHLELGWLVDYCPGPAGMPFVPWITGLIERRRIQGNERSNIDRRAVESGIQMLLASGITEVGDISTQGTSIGPLLESDLTGIVYVEVLGPRSWEAGERLNQARALIEHWRPRERSDLRIGFSIHAPYSTHRVLWEKALAYVRAERLPLCVHAAESPEEQEYMTLGSGPMANQQAMYQADVTVPHISSVRYLDDLGALELKPLLIHAVQVDDDDIRRIAAHGARVAHCPRSNLRLRCGRMPLEKYLAQGVQVYLGTDSLGSSPSLDVFEELETAVALHHGHVPAEAVEQLVYQRLPH